MALPPLLDRIVSWLRAGYPEGVPRQDYIPLLALLVRHLTPEAVTEVTQALLASEGQPVTEQDIRSAIEGLTKQPASEQDVARVAARLDEAGADLSSLGDLKGS